MHVTFCGHRAVMDEASVFQWLLATVTHLVQQGATTFYLGGYGRFDSLAAQAVRHVKANHPAIEVILVLPYLKPSDSNPGYDSTIYPPLESVPPRYAIAHRNRWMIEQADIVVAYVLSSSGGAAAMLNHARRKKKRILLFSFCTSLDTRPFPGV